VGHYFQFCQLEYFCGLLAFSIWGEFSNNLGLIEHALGNGLSSVHTLLIEVEVLGFYLAEAEHGKNGLNNGIGSLQLNSEPRVSLFDILEGKGGAHLMNP
jgi:hypothetical protein